MSDELLEAARLGIDAEVFLKSDLGRFLCKKADDERNDALNDLIAAAPDDVPANTEARNRIHVAGMFLSWVRSAVEVGMSAHEQIEADSEQ